MGERPPLSIAGGDAARLRARPPERTLAWLRRELGATEVVGVEALLGGSSSAMHRVELAYDDGAVTSVVLRRYVAGHVLAESPSPIEREVRALALLVGSPIPMPALLAVDEHGTMTDVAAVAMSWLDGQPVWEPRARRGWIRQVVDQMAAIHDVAVPATVSLAPIAPYRQKSWSLPRWVTDPTVWERALEVFHGPVPEVDVGFVHRDFHPGNLLWRRGVLTGIVDWQAAGVGPAAIDPAHCRLNLFFSDAALADDLRVDWERATGCTFHPWADIVSIIGTLDGLRDRPPGATARRTLETALGEAVAELGLG